MTVTGSHPSASNRDFATAIAATLDRIRGDRSGAVVTLCPDAVEIARGVERERPLAGMPFTAKDVIASAGAALQAGSQAFEGHVPSVDAPAIALVREAGAILV